MKTNKIQTIRVKTSSEYDVLIGENLIQDVGSLVGNISQQCKVALITDDVVDGIYSAVVTSSLEKCGFNVKKFVFPHGEQSKNLSTYSQIICFLADNEFTRTDMVLALGGGVTGDMAGFAAATFLRGLNYVQVPTTLLAQVDSSVGGKTAVDLVQGKNLVGAFKQPKLVICDTNILQTLPTEIFIDGMGEVAKYAILDKKVFDLINDAKYSIQKLVYLCIDYKRKIVECDEFEGGNRKLLNLGHTVAHGIERLSNYCISHGRAVAMGLKIILNASLKHGFINADQHKKMNTVIEKCVGEQTLDYEIEQICKASLTDKKRNGETISLITIHGVDDCREQKIKVDNMAEYLS